MNTFIRCERDSNWKQFWLDATVRSCETHGEKKTKQNKKCIDVSSCFVDASLVSSPPISQTYFHILPLPLFFLLTHTILSLMPSPVYYNNNKNNRPRTHCYRIVNLYFFLMILFPCFCCGGFFYYNFFFLVDIRSISSVGQFVFITPPPFVFCLFFGRLGNFPFVFFLNAGWSSHRSTRSSPRSK